MRGRRRGLSFGSILALLLTASVVVGSVLFFRAVGRDSKVASMGLREIAGSIGSAIGSPLESPSPYATQPLPGATAQPATPTPRPLDQPVRLSLSLGGMLRFDSDVMQSEGFAEASRDILKAISPMFQGDLCVAGFDQIITDSPRRGDSLRVSPSALQIIKQAGVWGLVLPVQRILDDGEAAAYFSLAQMQGRYLEPIGLGDSKSFSLRVNGLNIAWLHISQNISREGQAATDPAARERLLLPADEAAVGQLIAQLRADHDMIIVSVNQPTGSGTKPLPAQVTLAHRLAQQGADLVLGYGGDQIQELERYTITDGEGGQREVLIAYSLGTLLSENRAKRELYSGAVLQISLSLKPGGQDLRYGETRFSPTYVRRWTQQGKTYYQVLASAREAPADMSKAQQEAMARSLNDVRQVLEASGAVLQR